MRISDWSSDVCSSDLHELGLFLRRRRGAALHPVEGEDRHHRVRQGGEGKQSGRADCLHGARGQQRPEHRGRSEEHTSELQSLMRISYAVFCLKKKTQNTQTTKYHKLSMTQHPHIS